MTGDQAPAVGVTVPARGRSLLADCLWALAASPAALLGGARVRFGPPPSDSFPVALLFVLAAGARTGIMACLAFVNWWRLLRGMGYPVPPAPEDFP